MTPTSGANEDLIRRLREAALPDQSGYRAPNYQFLMEVADALRVCEEEKARLIAAAHKIFIHQSWSEPVWHVAADQADELWRAIRDIPPKGNNS